MELKVFKSLYMQLISQVYKKVQMTKLETKEIMRKEVLFFPTNKSTHMIKKSGTGSGRPNGYENIKDIRLFLYQTKQYPHPLPQAI